MFSNTSNICSKSQTVVLLIATTCACAVSNSTSFAASELSRLRDKTYLTNKLESIRDNEPGASYHRKALRIELKKLNLLERLQKTASSVTTVTTHLQEHCIPIGNANGSNVAYPDTCTTERQQPPSTSSSERFLYRIDTGITNEMLTQMTDEEFMEIVGKQALDSGAPSEEITKFFRALKYFNDGREDDEKSVAVRTAGAGVESENSFTLGSCGTDASIPNLFNPENEYIGVIPVSAAKGDCKRLFQYKFDKEFEPKIFGLFLGPNVFAILKFSYEQPGEKVRIKQRISFIECDSVNALWRNIERVKRFIRYFDIEQNREDGDIIDTVNRQELRYLSRKNPKTRAKTRRLRTQILAALRDPREQLNKEMQSMIQDLQKFKDDIEFGVIPPQGDNEVKYTDDSSVDDPELRSCVVSIAECVFSMFKGCFKWCIPQLKKYDTCCPPKDDCLCGCR